LNTPNIPPLLSTNIFFIYTPIYLITVADIVVEPALFVIPKAVVESNPKVNPVEKLP
jgi:hypothetical protein